jgi:hypothetical protein
MALTRSAAGTSLTGYGYNRTRFDLRPMGTCRIPPSSAHKLTGPASAQAGRRVRLPEGKIGQPRSPLSH